MKKIFSDLELEISRAYGENLRSILLYGSSAIGHGHDVDLLVILKNKTNPLSDTHALGEIRLGHPASVLDLQLMYEAELSQPSFFSLDSHGSFIIPVLREATVLFGENPFLDMYPDPNLLAGDVLKKIQYYLFRARRDAMGYQGVYNDANPDIHRKKIFKILFDISLAEKSNIDPANVLPVFKKLNPGILSADDLSLIKEKVPLSIKKALPIYEKLYTVALKKIPAIQVEAKPLKIRIGEIVSDALLAKKDVKGTIILCEGMPAVPERRDIMNRLCKLGFHVLYPRYRGTWESPGEFLKESPTADIVSLCDALARGLSIGSHKISSKNIILIGSSFGGAVAIDSAKHPSVKRVIALSPIVDFLSLRQSLSTLPAYLKNMYPGAYRFTDAGWSSLSSNLLIAPLNQLASSSAKKIFIFGGEEDDTISAEHLNMVPKNVKKRLKIYPDKGHLSFSKVIGEVLDNLTELL